MRTGPARVLMTADAVGGVWTYAMELAGALSEIEFLIATMGPLPSGAQRAGAAALANVELITSTFQLEWMDAPWDDVRRAGDWIQELESQFCPDLVHLNGYAHGALPFRAPVVMVGHSCLLSWAEAIPHAIDPTKLASYLQHVAPGLRGADLVIAPSHTMLDALQRFYGPLSHTSVVFNGRRAELFQPAEKQPVVMTAGRLWDRAKNVQGVSAVAARLPWRTVVAGASAFDETGAPLCLPGVHLLGALDERALAQWLGRASIFALPARYEPFGLLPLEAALSGCALILGDIPSLREIWGDAAVFVPPDDTDALAHAIASLIASPHERQRRSQIARTRAATFSVDVMANGYREAYTRATTASRHGALTCTS